MVLLDAASRVPTRILDWSDGALIALHFAVRDKSADDGNSLVFVLDPYRLLDDLKLLPDRTEAKERWSDYISKNPGDDLADDDWDRTYLPGDEEDQNDLPLPQAPVLSDGTQITRRIAAQRSRFMIFGTNPSWMSDLADRTDSPIKILTIEAGATRRMTDELRDAGVTESVIFPDLDGLGRELSQRWRDRR
jgi:hypothetical protein